MLDREQALALLNELGPEKHLIQHALASEAVMRALARHLGEDEEVWGLTGLLHDLDYPLTHEDPAKHGLVGAERIGDRLPEEALHAIRAHNGEMTGVAPSSAFDYALRCGETVTGLVVTAALVRPTGMEGMQASSLKKKMKDKAFAASVNRDCIRQCSELGLELGDFLTLAIGAMADLDAELGLRKSAARPAPTAGRAHAPCHRGSAQARHSPARGYPAAQSSTGHRAETAHILQRTNHENPYGLHLSSGNRPRHHERQVENDHRVPAAERRHGAGGTGTRH